MHAPSGGHGDPEPATMRLEIRLFAALRERAGRERLELDGLPRGISVAELRDEVARRHPELGDLGAVACVVGTRYVPLEHRLTAPDAVALLPPVSGGAPESEAEGDDAALSAGVFELSPEPLEPGALHARLVHPSCGAVVLFTGMTREHNRGHAVERLDYEAFEEMAGPEMARIFEDCRARFGVAGERELRMLCVHRVGTVGVAEPSVVVGVASAHRDSAFLAARFLIDALKERLPVWKKEVYRDGHHWIGDRS